MKKEIQKEINAKVEKFVTDFNDRPFHYQSCERLRSCRAHVYISDKYYILQSYNTIVAGIDRDTGECFDFLRYVYGFNSTSSQHIDKFFSDYGSHRYRSEETIYTWYAV